MTSPSILDRINVGIPQRQPPQVVVRIPCATFAERCEALTALGMPPPQDSADTPMVVMETYPLGKAVGIPHPTLRAWVERRHELLAKQGAVEDPKQGGRA